MDDWAKAHCPASRVKGWSDPHDDPWGDIRVDRMSVCEEMMQEGWLVRTDPPLRGYEFDDYIRTDKSAP
jgi:hypothetical protein